MNPDFIHNNNKHNIAQMIHCTEISIKEGIFGAHHKNMLNNLGLLSSKRSNSLDMVTLQNFGIGFGLTILTSEIRRFKSDIFKRMTK